MRLAILFAVVSSAAFAADASVTASADYTSAYTFRGTKLANDSVQPAVNVAVGPVYIGAWANRPLDSARNSEVDFTAGANGPGGFDAGLTAYTYPGSAKTTWEPYLGYAIELGAESAPAKAKASLYVYRDLTLLITSCEAKLSVPVLTRGSFSISGDAALGMSTGSIETYSYWSVGPTVRFAATKSLSIIVAAQYVSSDDRTLDRDIVSGRLGVAYTY